MMALPQSRAPFLILFVLILSLAVSACGTDPSKDVISPGLGAKLVAQAANAEVEVVPTPEPLGIADLSEEEITAGLPEDFAAALAAASAENGETVALTNGCIGCHALDPDQTDDRDPPGSTPAI